MRAWLFILIFIPCTLQSQVYGGVSLGQSEYVYIVWEEDVGFAMIQASYLTNLNTDNMITLKFGIRVINYAGFQLYAYAPFFNMSVKDKSYNTPVGVEVFYRKRLSFNVDVYRNGIRCAIRYRYPLVVYD